ncbi:MAG: DUF3566 domain-containing protein [Acidimicrobiia bacterium]
MGAVGTAQDSRKARRREAKAAKAQAVSIARTPAVSQRQYRQTVRQIRLWSVLKISLCFYTAALVVILVAGIALWAIAASFGYIDSFEKFMGTLLSNKNNYKLVSAELLLGSTLVGVVLVALMTILTVIAAAFYNLFAELFGGVEVVVVEAELERR